MGCAATKPLTEEDKEAMSRSRDIDNQLRKERKDFIREIKCLLLGAGESGKSTVAKQMKIIHLNGFSDEERALYRPILHNNVLGAMKQLVLASRRFEFEVSDSNKETARLFAEEINPLKMSLSPELAAKTKALWEDEGIQKAYAQRSNYQLPDSAAYVLDSVERIAQPDYLPSEEDVLRGRARTTGIIEVSFTCDEVQFRVVDVGGQRSERKKWIHCFQEVTCLIFCVALSAFDMKLYEDENVNRMHESLELFDEIVNSKWFLETSIILFLNKSDLFREKIERVDLNVCFPEYTGGLDFLNATQFIEQKFNSTCKTGNKYLYTHITCATDTKNIRFVFNAIKDILLHKNLEISGF